MWWDGNDDERYWVEIRRRPGLGTLLYAPNRDVNGQRNAWYDLVSTVRKGNVVYHYNARESRFVGRSRAEQDAIEDTVEGSYEVSLTGFEPLVAPVDLQVLRDNADLIYQLRDDLKAAASGPLNLPFQFTTDRSQLRMMSNYFAKLPASLVPLLFGDDGLGGDLVTTLPPLPGDGGQDHDGDSGDGSGGGTGPGGDHDSTDGGGHPLGPERFLDPFAAKADTDYVVDILGGRHKRTRAHETLVNNCAAWLREQGFETGRNAAIDLGLTDGHVIIEAKIVKSWPIAIREAIGQLYEYRYFQICEPASDLIFLADQPVPADWIRYLEKDRKIGAIWFDNGAFHLSELAEEIMDV